MSNRFYPHARTQRPFGGVITGLLPLLPMVLHACMQIIGTAQLMIASCSNISGMYPFTFISKVITHNKAKLPMWYGPHQTRTPPHGCLPAYRDSSRLCESAGQWPLVEFD